MLGFLILAAGAYVGGMKLDDYLQDKKYKKEDEQRKVDFWKIRNKQIAEEKYVDSLSDDDREVWKEKRMDYWEKKNKPIRRSIDVSSMDDAIKMSEIREGYRNLIRNECEVLQNVPIDYTLPVSDRKAKIMLGNGWTVDVITHTRKNNKPR